MYAILGFFNTLHRALALQYRKTVYKTYDDSCGGYVGWWEDAQSGQCIAFLDDDGKVKLDW